MQDLYNMKQYEWFLIFFKEKERCTQKAFLVMLIHESCNPLPSPIGYICIEPKPMLCDGYS